MISRGSTRTVSVGGVKIGGGSPVSVQSMTNTDTRDVAATVRQINLLAEAGCEIVRVAVPDMEAASAIGQIKREISLPLVADIHFDYRLALEAVKCGADKLRLNPGTIGRSKIKEVARAAKSAGIPIRVGVNGGSLEKAILAKHGGVTADGLAESAFRNINLLERYGFEDIVVSIKATNIGVMLGAHRAVCEKSPYPVHLGLTEAGTVYSGAIRSAAGLGALLSLGIGDTVRVSLSGDPAEEIRAAKLILSAMGLRRFGATVIACPTCGRAGVDVAGIAARLESRLAGIKTPMTVAVMGCAVNGPGEAREADIGIAGGKGTAVFFRKGEIVRSLGEAEIFDALVCEAEKLEGSADVG